MELRIVLGDSSGGRHCSDHEVRVTERRRGTGPQRRSDRSVEFSREDICQCPPSSGCHVLSIL